MDLRPATSCQRLPTALLLALAGCGGNVNVFGIYFAPWMACVMAGALLGYAVTRLLERHLFDYDPRYFAWAFLALTALFSLAFWFIGARG
jgi:hypothetical protein